MQERDPKTGRLARAIATMIFLGCSVAICPGVARSQVTNQKGHAGDPDSLLNVREMSATVLDRNLHFGVRNDAFQELCQLDCESREAELVRVLDLADDAYSSMAAVALLTTDKIAVGVTEKIEKHFLDWSEHYRITFLQHALTSIRPERFETARFVLEALVDGRSKVHAGTEFHANSVDIAALVLSNSEDSKDALLLERAAVVAPTSFGAWLGIASKPTWNEELESKAIAVYMDSKVTIQTRLAAATALSPHNEMARRFLIERLEAIVSQFANQSMDKIIAADRNDRKMVKVYLAYQQDLRLLSVLRYLRSEFGEELVLRSCNCTNEGISKTLRIIAATRWPKRFVESVGQDTMGESMDRYLALAVFNRPEIRALAESKGDAERITLVELRIREGGIRSVFGTSVVYAEGW